MGEILPSEKFEGTFLCDAASVREELGAIVDRATQTAFKEETRDVVLEGWCRKEEARFYETVSILRSQLTDENVLSMAQDVVLNKVVVRVLRRIQANRTNVPGGTPSYREVMEDYGEQARIDEHYIKHKFHPYTKPRDEEAPPVIDLEVKVQDEDTEEFLAGARVIVNDQWLTSTWKDGIVNFSLVALADDADPYEIYVQFAGYENSAVQLIDETGTYVFQLTPE